MYPVNVAVVDTETSGLEKDDVVVEFAAVNPFGVLHHEYFQCHKPLPPEVSAVHHITDADLAEHATMPWATGAGDAASQLEQGHSINYLVAHNAEFDRGMMGKQFENFSWICTMKAALILVPDAPNFKNETLCYYLGVGARGRSARGGGAHSADFDAAQTSALFDYLFGLVKEQRGYDDQQALDWFVQITGEPKQYSRIGFGKHAGSLWKDVDPGYLIWMTKQADMDKDYKACAQAELNRRYPKK